MQGRLLRGLAPLALLRGAKKGPATTRCDEDLTGRDDFAAAVQEANGWHFAMLRDEHRARQFERAIRKVVKPGDVVLDVGTGTGLLGLMASRCGGEVVACEGNSSFAAVARRVVHDNGASFPVVAKNSLELEVPGDLPRPADVLVGEVLSSSLFGEGILKTMRDAHKRLLRPGAAVIPRRAALSFALVEWNAVHRGSYAGEVAGLDLSAFNTFRVEHRLIQLPPLDSSVRQLTEAQVGVEVDFGNPEDPLLAQPTAFARDFHLRVQNDGQCQLVVVWWDASLDAEGEICLSTNPFEPLPAFRHGHWGARAQVLPLVGKPQDAIQVRKGDMVHVRMTLTQNRPDPQPHFTVTVVRCP